MNRSSLRMLFHLAPTVLSFGFQSLPPNANRLILNHPGAMC